MDKRPPASGRDGRERGEREIEIGATSTTITTGTMREDDVTTTTTGRGIEVVATTSETTSRRAGETDTTTATAGRARREGRTRRERVA